MALLHARQEGRLLQTHTEVVATPGSSSTVTSPALPGVATNQSVTTAYDPYSARRARSASTATPDAHLMGAEIMFGTTLIGHVEGLVHDPISQRVRRLITSYGSTRFATFTVCDA